MKEKRIQYLVLLAATALLVAVIFFSRQLIAQQNEHRPPPQIGEKMRPNVRVVTVSRGIYTARIKGFGEASPHFSLPLASQKAGLVVEQSTNFEPGSRVTEGEILVRLDDTDYQKTLAEVENELASAKLELLEEEREAAQAKAEWEGSGLTGSPDSPLVLHAPQLTVAKTAVKQAEAAVLSAKKDIERTRIRAPFDAVVVERVTTPGSYLQAGTEVATLYSTDMVEIAVPLSANDWNNLPEQKTLIESNWPARLTGVESGTLWSGRVLRSQQHLDETSRQRTIYLAVDKPFSLQQPLLPGTFVQVDLAGKSVSNVWELPDTALSQRGEIWYVKEDNTLASFPANPVFTNGSAIYIKAPDHFGESVRIVVHPLSSYLSGMAVNPVEEKSNA